MNILLFISHMLTTLLYAYAHISCSAQTCGDRSNPLNSTRENEARRCRKTSFFCFWCYASQTCLWSVATKIKVGYQPLAECSSCKGPRGERNGKALSGASISERSSQSVNSHKKKRKVVVLSTSCAKKYYIYLH